MPWYCPNEFCPVVRELQPNEKCPVCGRAAIKFGGFLGKPLGFLLERKSTVKEWTPPPKCGGCGNEMVYVPYSKERARGIPVYVCMKCMKSTCNIPDHFLEIWIGKVVSGIDRVTGIARIRIEQPKGKSGISPMRVLHYNSFQSWEREKIYLKRGDSVAVGGYYDQSGNFIGVYYKNFTVNSEGSLLGSDETIRFRRSLIPGQRLTDFIEFRNLLSLRAQEMVEKIIQEYGIRNEKELIARTSSYHEQAGSFELLIAQLLERMGFKDVNVSGGASDKGVDIEAYTEDPFGNRERIIVQCKYQDPTNKVKPTQVRDFAHVIEREKAHGVRRGYFITSSYFSPECFEEGNCGKNMELIDRDRLGKLLRDKGLEEEEL